MSNKFLIPVLLVVSAALLFSLYSLNKPELQYKTYSPIGDSQSTELGTLVDALWQGAKPGESELVSRLDAMSSPVYIAARRRGKRQAHIWRDEGSSLDSLNAALQGIRRSITDERVIASIDSFEVVFAYDFEDIPFKKRFALGNIDRGVRGLEIRLEEDVERISPTYMLATNQNFTKVIQRYLASKKLLRDPRRNNIELRNYSADTWLVNITGDSSVTRQMERGNEYVPIASVTRENVHQLGALATEWLANNLHENGRMTYKYWPSIRQESKGNNMIRQWMATVALIRAGKKAQDEALLGKAAKNIQFNLDNFYREERGYGLIEFNGKVKLGAVALAALALAEHPDRRQWRNEELAMQRTIDFLWQENGAFRTFYKPATRNDVQNFYPGEALLYWATLFEETQDKTLLNKIMLSFKYYRDWHLTPTNRNPAFIPWHTQAYYKVWKITGNEALKDFVFKTNDWLIDEMQQWTGQVKYPDALGRFYNPNKRYGPPHVSSTGVYMEGLIDAFLMARALGDSEREYQYRQAIQRGLRSVMQLQFVDEVDMYYIPLSLRERVRGGMRTTLYNNEIRCDNVQHNLMAILKILSGFEDGDFVAPAGS